MNYYDKTEEVIKLLGSDYYWEDARGNKHILSNMSIAHIKNALSYLDSFGEDLEYFRCERICDQKKKLRAELYRRHCLGEDITA